jgi:two-component system sensor histidine kinase RegB
MLSPRSKAAPRIALPWIIRLRYGIVAGQFATALVVEQFFGIRLPMAWISIPIALVAISNLWLSRRSGESSLVAGIFVLDTLCLTAVLMLTGGPSNPFTLLYLVHITLAATILTQRQTWALGVLACCCFALLFWWYRPIPQLEMHHYGDGMNLHLIGMWVSFVLATLLVTLFSGKISELLREREEQLARKDRLAALVTLAAGAAHELSTPLATIAVVAKELEHYATRTVRDNAIAEDCRLIRTEVDRCHNILQRMSAEGSEPAGEAFDDVPVADVVEVARNTFASGALKIEASHATGTLRIPRHAVEQALIALIKNAFEAGPPGSPVRLSVSGGGGYVCFEVQDQGSGMDEEAMRHAGEPFFSTKEPGKGMGLGIFLVRSLAERLGGHLAIESALNQGTAVTLKLPLAGVPRHAAA